ncbi:MAG: chemotaxis response regulator protein-glutamate methylesterase [Alicyclobacillus macrosporangiidus]|uniref:protein-glutamate methylesterase/protein-glutamine glutaminase n=1 Tax=Alicyclobacillus macrosporangiidus TaxID=392015 RepID=UPI0026EF99E9|nr:chemotaxis response regulator protein-glutamate methylesterase [Alicyclobacillus macrosporangiidus]MCL6600190.1 chemotaxis response regulator protein-glutamate methylesterase [Alicyclobacillus macrosporangiidus]
MSKYGVLVVDDSAFMRRSISLLIESDQELFVAGIARNGLEALEKVKRIKPHIVTMDVEMPEMDGITTLAQIMKECPVPVVMLSVSTESGAQSTIKALELGAVDFFLKNTLIKEKPEPQIIKDFLSRLKLAAHANIQKKSLAEAILPKPEEEQDSLDVKKDLLIIGCSTGGPSALQAILPRFSADFPIPILVLQHMPPGFTKPLADRLNTMCNLRVKEAEDGERLVPGTVFVGPAGAQTLLAKRRDQVELLIRTDVPVQSLYKPCIDVTLLSAAPLYRDRLLAVILTGMGSDGLEGCKSVKENHGHVIVQAEESCVVYGMPKVVFEAGYADRQGELSTIYQHIQSFVR